MNSSYVKNDFFLFFQNYASPDLDKRVLGDVVDIFTTEEQEDDGEPFEEKMVVKSHELEE